MPRRRSGSCAPLEAPAFRRWSRSPSRPTGGSQAASRSRRRSSTWTRRRTAPEGGGGREGGARVVLPRRYGDLRRQLPSLNVVGGCCEPTTGTSGRSAASGRPASPDRWVDPAAAPLYNEGRLRLDRRNQGRLRRGTATSRRTSGRD